MIDVISLGAGKQSSYMLLRALEGAFEYTPAFAIFCDTGCEPKFVYEWFYWLKSYVLKKYNFNIIIVSDGNIMKDTLDFLNGKRKGVPCLPLFTAAKGLLQRQCTFSYKISPLRRYLQKNRNGSRVRLWLGISLDEIERMRVSNVKYIENYYPLIDNRIRIDSIKPWFAANNFQEPMKSSCLICPFHSEIYWQRFKKVFPIEFEEACKFDDKIRIYPNFKDSLFLSKKLKPLRNIDFSMSNSLFPELIEECEGLCGL